MSRRKDKFLAFILVILEFNKDGHVLNDVV